MMDNIELTPELIEMFIENTPIAYVLLDEERRIHYINKSFLKLRQLDLATTMGEYCYNISNGGVPCPNCAVEAAIASRQKQFIARRDRLPDGSLKYIDDYAIPLNDISASGHHYTLEVMINRSEEMQQREKRNRDFGCLVGVMSKLLESKDGYTAKHSENVSTISYHIAKAMQLSDDEVFEITLAAQLHDIGKVGIPYSLINKPSRLTDDEFDVIKSHVVKSYEFLEKLESFKSIAEIVKNHHERIDGKGYPNGLKGDELSLGTRIVAVADTYEAMTSDRSYRKALSHETAIAELERVAGTQLDAEVVATFKAMNFSYDTYKSVAEINLKGEDKFSGVDRIITKDAVTTKQANFSNLNLGDVDRTKLLKQIFDHTPCGYVLMKPDYTVLYASPYFLDYMGLTLDQVQGHRCYTVGTENGRQCSDCAIKMAVESGKPYKIRREQQTKNGYKIFDMYGIPLMSDSNGVEYTIEVIIDRTDEVLLERERLKDYKCVFDLLTNLIRTKGVDADDREMVNKIPELSVTLARLFKSA